jgi:hypothetical protein
MGTKGKRNPDHFQVHPAPVHDPGLVAKAPSQGRSPLPRPVEHPRLPLVRAGVPLDHPHTVRCMECGMETTLPAHEVVAPCRRCGGAAYRVVA